MTEITPLNLRKCKAVILHSCLPQFWYFLYNFMKVVFLNFRNISTLRYSVLIINKMLSNCMVKLFHILPPSLDLDIFHFPFYIVCSISSNHYGFKLKQNITYTIEYIWPFVYIVTGYGNKYSSPFSHLTFHFIRTNQYANIIHDCNITVSHARVLLYEKLHVSSTFIITTLSCPL